MVRVERENSNSSTKLKSRVDRSEEQDLNQPNNPFALQMVHQERESSNALIDKLADWNNLLQQSIIDFEGLAE